MGAGGGDVGDCGGGGGGAGCGYVDGGRVRSRGGEEEGDKGWLAHGGGRVSVARAKALVVRCACFCNIWMKF